MRNWALIFLLVVAMTAVACAGDKAQPVALPATTVPQFPTPTLAPGLPTVPPATPTRAAETAGAANLSVATAESSAAAVPTLTPFPTATQTPLAVERVDLAATGLQNGDYGAAASQLEASVLVSDSFSTQQQIDNLYSLGVAYLGDERYGEAVQAFERLLSDYGEAAPSAANFQLGQAYQAVGNLDGAAAAYEAYVAQNADLGGYVYPLLADVYTAAGNSAAAYTAREQAAASPAHRLTEIGNRRLLAGIYMSEQDYPAAVAQYDAMRNLAQTQFTQGEMNYLAGYAEQLAGADEEAYARFQQGLATYPEAYESYLGLVALVDAGIVVDDFQRGLVNLNADSYEPAVAAFNRYIGAQPEPFASDAHLYAAWSYEGLGDLTNALAALEAYAVYDPARATIERSRLLARFGDVSGALDNYLFYLENYPDGPDAPFAAWWSAAIAEGAGDVATAITRYTALADGYPAHEDAPEALYRAGWLAYNGGDVVTAVRLWQRVAEAYPESEFGGAALVWLLRILPEMTSVADQDGEVGVPDPHKALAFAEQLASENQATHYYALRAQELATGAASFAAKQPFALPDDVQSAADQIEAETWLREWQEVEPGTDIASLPGTIASDPRLIRGQKLWQLGLLEEAKRELEALRVTYWDDPIASYQLALFFRDLGLYRSSILAAARLPALSGQSLFEIPRFIGRLIYPVHYEDLVLPLAEQYGYDPRLQFGLLRQESLFESFATSTAVAQGLSQVIPDTGAYIAQRLNWPDYDNEDLYKPYVGLNFGAYYLDLQLEAFNQDVHAALSAYNAGPGNAARWYELAGSDLDQYLETVDFAETKQYIKRIFEGYVMYDYLYGDSVD